MAWSYLLIWRSFSVQFSLFLHPNQAQNTLSGIQGQEVTAIAVIYVTAPTSSRKTTKYKWNTIAKKQQKTYIVKTVIRLVNSPHINTFWRHFHCQKSIPNCIWKHCFHTGKLYKALTTWDDTVPTPGQPVSVNQSQQSNKQINKWKMRHMSAFMCYKHHQNSSGLMRWLMLYLYPFVFFGYFMRFCCGILHIKITQSTWEPTPYAQGQAMT